MKAFLEKIRRQCARQLIDYQTIRTSEHLDAALGLLPEPSHRHVRAASR